jgi:two-component system phosphate regulon sensor histidine kinase PhoR
MAGGDLATRARAAGDDELAALGAALDALATSLSGTLAQLRAERDLQLRILEGMQEGVLVTDENAHIVLVNPTLRSMLLLRGDVLGRHVLEVVRVADLDALLATARETREPAQGEIEIGGIKPRRLLVHASALEGEDRGLLAVFVDVTDVRRLESLRRDFVANVSHELRTPVAAVLSATETLRTGALKDPAAAERFLAIVERNATRLQALIEDLLELSRLDAREYAVRKERVVVDALVGVVVSLFRERAEKKRIELASDVPSPSPVVETDPRALEQILGNLIDNAIKYCPAGSRVTVRVTGDEADLCLAVQDNGPGIAARHLPRLFERFYRVDAGRSREVGGTGLGLSIVKHLAEALGGAVTVTSAPGSGSTFTLTLPLRRAG